MRMTKIAFIALSALGIAACSESTISDGGTDTGVQLFFLESGNYDVMTVLNVNDGCEIGLSGFVGGDPFPLTVNNQTGVVTLGNMQGDPQVPSFGSGVVSNNTGTLEMSTHIVTDAPATCTIDRSVTTGFTMTEDYAFTIALSRTDLRDAICDTEEGTTLGTSCTSTATMTFRRAAQ